MGIDIEKYLGWRKHECTNADKIRAMTNEQLAEWLIATGCCPPGVDVEELCFPDSICNQLDLGQKCWLKWLEQEAQE